MSDVTILVSTFDGHQAAWKPFWHGFKKYWPDCPWPIRFITNELDAPCGNPIKVGPDRNWTAMHRAALAEPHTRVFFLLLEDYWLTHPVNTQALVEFADIVLYGEADRILLCKGTHTSYGPYEPDRRLNIYADKSIYRTALQAGLWNVGTFLNLLRDGETPWHFETKGSIRSQGWSAPFLNEVEHNYIRYIFPNGAIKRGKWTPAARKYAAREKLRIDFNAL